jgi:hypothetical protein
MMKSIVLLSLIAAAGATTAPSCKACDSGKVADIATKAGCVACTADAKVNKAVYTCEIATAGGSMKANTLKIAAVASPASEAEKYPCKEGYYVKVESGKDDTCAECKKKDSGCYTCSDGTDNNCTVVSAGYYLKDGVPVACTNAAACTKKAGTVTQSKTDLCKAFNTLAADPGSVASACKTCVVTYSVSSTKATDSNVANVIKKDNNDGCVACPTIVGAGLGSVTSCTIKTSDDIVDPGSAVITARSGGRQCKPGRVYFKANATTNGACPECAEKAECHTCSSTAAKKCTSPAAGYTIVSEETKACIQVGSCDKGSSPRKKTIAEACPVGNTVGVAQLTKTNGCGACLPGTVAGDSSAVCTTCGTIAGSAGTLTCTVETGKDTVAAGSVDVTVDPATNLKCDAGRFYEAPSGTTNAKCTPCHAGCATCDNKDTCLTMKAGYAVASKPTACVDVADADCKAETTNKLGLTKALACPASNLCTAINDKTVSTNSAVCKVVAPAPTPQGGNAATVALSTLALLVATLAL